MREDRSSPRLCQGFLPRGERTLLVFRKVRKLETSRTFKCLQLDCLACFQMRLYIFFLSETDSSWSSVVRTLRAALRAARPCRAALRAIANKDRSDLQRTTRTCLSALPLCQSSEICLYKLEEQKKGQLLQHIYGQILNKINRKTHLSRIDLRILQRLLQF